MHNKEGIWLSIADYSQYKKISVSTIRRHIRSNILKHKEVEGKYFIYVSSLEKIKLKEEDELIKLKLELELLRNENRFLKEENNELKMLVNLYESKNLNSSLNSELPELPKYI